MSGRHYYYPQTRHYISSSPSSLSAHATHTLTNQRAPARTKQTTYKQGDNTGKYSSVLDCFVKTARNDGPLAFYNGFLPNFARLG